MTSQSLRRLSKGKTFRVLLLGQKGVGKTALTVRFITRRFIGEYDSTRDQKYRHTCEVDEDPINFEVLDTVGFHRQDGQIEERRGQDENIRWSDAFLLLYDICDECSFNEVTRLKLLIQYNKKARRPSPGGSVPAPLVFLVGNKCDVEHERMITTSEGQQKADTLGCVQFHEISVRESRDDAAFVFHQLYRQSRASKQGLRRLRSPPQVEDITDNHSSLSTNSSSGKSELTDYGNCRLSFRRKALLTLDESLPTDWSRGRTSQSNAEDMDASIHRRAMKAALEDMGNNNDSTASSTATTPRLVLYKTIQEKIMRVLPVIRSLDSNEEKRTVKNSDSS